MPNAIIHSIPFHSLEAGTVDHFDDLLLGHFDLAAGFDGVVPMDWDAPPPSLGFKVYLVVHIVERQGTIYGLERDVGI